MEYLKRSWERLPLLLFRLTIALTLVAYGVLVGKYHWFPHDQFVSAKKTALTLIKKIRG